VSSGGYVRVMTPGDTAPVLVTGGSGRLGRLVVDELVSARVPVRALARRPAMAMFPTAVEVVEGDFTTPDSLESALRDVSAVFLVWTLPYATAPAVVERLARHASRVVFLSAPHRTPHPFFQQPNPMAQLHASIEQLLVDSRMIPTIIRPGMFASNALNWWAPTIRGGQTIRWPYGAAETAPVDDGDVAAVAAKVLTDVGRAGGDYVLTGPESLSQAEQIHILATAINREIAFEELSPDQFRRETADTWPRPVVDMLLSAWEATMGQPAYVTSSVSELLGRPARTFHEWATDNASAFT
jgi:uncharacterized protein YbjT (DUF2867 family)